MIAHTLEYDVFGFLVIFSHFPDGVFAGGMRS